jgi:hypothetical protein
MRVLYIMATSKSIGEYGESACGARADYLDMKAMKLITLCTHFILAKFMREPHSGLLSYIYIPFKLNSLFAPLCCGENLG